jgi:hypothetical protein
MISNVEIVSLVITASLSAAAVDDVKMLIDAATDTARIADEIFMAAPYLLASRPMCGVHTAVKIDNRHSRGLLHPKDRPWAT